MNSFLAVKDQPQIATFPSRELQVLSAMYEHQLIGEFPLSYFDTELWATRYTSWLILLGINSKEPIDEYEEHYLVDALVNEFKGHSFAEIELALRMCLMDEFAEPIEAYNRLNLRFLAKVMKAYRLFRKNVANKYEEIKFKLEKPVPIIPTAEDLDFVVGNQILDDYLRLGNNIDIFGISTKADLLIKIGEISIDDVKPLALEFKKQVLERKLETIINKEEKRRIELLQDDDSRLNIHVDNRAKDIIYRKYLNIKLNNKVPVEELLNLLESSITTLHTPSSTLPPPHTPTT